MTGDVTFHLLQRIADALGVSPDDLVAAGETRNENEIGPPAAADADQSLDLIGCFVETDSPERRALLLRVARALARPAR